MKKTLPKITLIAYIVAVVVCLSCIIVGLEVHKSLLIIFPVIIIAIVTMMFLSTRMVIKKKLADRAKKELEVPFEGLTCTDEAATVAEAPEYDDVPVVSEVFAEEPTQQPVAEEFENDPEVDVISTEGADDEDNTQSLVVPVVLGESNESEEEKDESVPEEDMITSIFSQARYVRTYASKLIQAEDELKGYYSIIKNTFMSYKKVTCSVSREHERVRCGRTTIGIIKIRGKTILLYLALDPNQFKNTMYVGEDVSEMSKYESTPFLYRVNGPRKASRAARLISMMAEKLNMSPTTVPANEDYVARFPYETTEELVAKGLITDTAAETEETKI